MKKTSWLDGLNKINEFAEVMEYSTLGNIKEYISTGSLTLNNIICGDLRGGIPSGRITTLMGKSGTGKSFIAAKIVKEAQDKDYDVIWFDSENATDKHFLKRLGIDTTRVIYLPISTIEEFRNQTFKILEKFEAKGIDQGRKLLIILDSLGNLCSEKELEDVAKGHNANDMGLRAKIIKSMTRVLTPMLARLNVPLIVVNHTYMAAGSYVPEEIPAGGEGVNYLSSIMVLLTKKRLKESKEDVKTVTGNILKALTKKNRLVPEFQRAEVKVDFEKGVDKYFGLLPFALKCGAIKEEGRKYTVDHMPDKKLWERELYCDDVFEPIFDIINEYLKDHNKFSSVDEHDVEVEKQELLLEKEEDNG